jgi:membrane-bound lytic murein transglycosylase A
MQRLLIPSLFFSVLSCWHCQEPKPPVRWAFSAVRPLVYNDSILNVPLPPRPLSSAMIPVKPDSLPVLQQIDAGFFKALNENIKYLNRNEIKDVPVKGIYVDEMARGSQIMQVAAFEPVNAWLDYFDFYQINTELKKDRVRITGYYTPTIDASRVRTAEFTVPMLRRPEHVPSPAAIEGGALEGQGLELAWLRSKRELANAQLQGSCMITFPDGDQDFLGFGGSVKGAGGTYVFFTKINKEVLGSGSFPIVAGYSAAIDPRFIPLGAMLLAELPTVDKRGNNIGYRYRVIFAHDRGGAIQTTKRLDLYCGIGKKGLEAAKRVNSYGRLWLMLPKR